MSRDCDRCDILESDQIKFLADCDHGDRCDPIDLAHFGGHCYLEKHLSIHKWHFLNRKCFFFIRKCRFPNVKSLRESIGGAA